MSDIKYTMPTFDRYLRLIGIERAEPCWSALEDITSAHLIRIPFENISKIHRARVKGVRGIPSLDEFLDGIEQGFGGTCYTNNYYLHVLLKHLEYDVKLCGADIAIDGAPANGHMVNVVTVDGREALVDVGYGAAFWRPIPRDSKEDVEQKLGTERYVLKPQDNLGSSRLEMYRDGQLRHGYLLKPEPMGMDEFSNVIARSYGDNAPFLNNLFLSRFYQNSCVDIRNYTLIELEKERSAVRKLQNKEDLTEVIVERFDMPESVVIQALNSINEFTGINS